MQTPLQTRYTPSCHLHFPMAVVLPRNGPKNRTIGSSPRPGIQIPQISFQSSICGTCRNKSNKGLSLQPTGLEGCDTNGVRDHQTPTPLSQPSLIHCGASLDWTWSSMSHGCSILRGEPTENCHLNRQLPLVLQSFLAFHSKFNVIG